MIKAGVFERLETEAPAAYGRIIGLEPHRRLGDASSHKPLRRPRNREQPTDRAELGIKRPVHDRPQRHPLASVINSGRQHDTMLFGPALQAAGERGLLPGAGPRH